MSNYNSVVKKNEYNFKIKGKTNLFTHFEMRRNFLFNHKHMTAGNQHSENDNEKKKRATIKQKTNKNKMSKLYHARGVFQSSVSWVTMDGARESCGDDWVNRVRLASDRASTDCWQRPCPVSCCKSGANPRKLSKHPSTLPLRLPPPLLPSPRPPGSHLPIKTSDGKIERQLFAPVI